MKASEIAELVGGTLHGDPNVEINGVAGIEDAGSDELSFVSGRLYARYVATTNAGILIVSEDLSVSRTDITLIRAENPHRSFLQVLDRFVAPAPRPLPGIHPSAVIGQDVELGDDVSVGPFVVIGDGCSIGARTVLMPGSVLGVSVSVGSDSVLGYNVSVYRHTTIGNHVIIHAGTVIGADGFGYLEEPDGSWRRIPQIGTVEIEDDVEIGANVTVDRAALGVTRIGRGTKIDNLVHIAHNVRIGSNTAIAAQTGVSGSTKIGEQNRIAGQVGIVGHIETAPQVIIEAQSGVSKTIRKAGRYFGHPAKEHSQALRQEGALRQLPDVLREIRELRNRIRRLEESIDIPEGDEIT